MRPPPVWFGFVGQANAVRRVRTYADGALERGESMPVTIIRGDCGSGKTELPKAIARCFGTEVHRMVGCKELTVVEYARTVTSCKPFAILHGDEAHAISREVQEWLLRLIDRRVIPKTEQKDGARAARVVGECPAPKVGLVLSTNLSGRLLRALRSRCMVEVTLRPYPPRELFYIARQMAARRSIVVTPQAATLIAKSAAGLPRNVELLIEGLTYRYTTAPTDGFTVEHVREILDIHQIDRWGRSEDQQEYMRFLHRLGGDGVSLTTLVHGMRVDETELRERVEPYLIHQGWVTIESGGRTLTHTGRAIVEADYAELPKS